MLLIYNIIDKKLAISSVKFTNISFDFNLHNKNSNPLDKFLSEIIYLFKKSEIKVVFFEEGHNKEIFGNIKPIFEEQILEVSGKKIKFENILDIIEIK